MTEVPVALGFIFLFLLFITESKNFYFVTILGIVIALVALDVSSYFVVGGLSEWFKYVYLFIAVYGLAKAVWIANKAYKKGKSLNEEVY